MTWPCSSMNGTSCERTSSTALLAPVVAVEAEAGIEEAGIMDPELADHGVVGDHLGGMVGRHRHRLARRQDVELVGVEDQAAIAVDVERLPELAGVVAADQVDVDHVGVLLGAEADQPAGRPRP